jgi:hypothetical protein
MLLPHSNPVVSSLMRASCFVVITSEIGEKQHSAQNKLTPNQPVKSRKFITNMVRNHSSRQEQQQEGWEKREMSQE